MSSLAKIKWWHLGIAFLVSLPISAYLLRQNNLTMIELRDEVVKVDQKNGDISKIEPKLVELRDYVLTHMNASLPAPLELPGSFNKAVDQARKAAEESGQVQSGIYSQAQAHCEDANVPLSVRAECIQNFVTTNAQQGEVVNELDIPPKERFVYSFVSPTWSFDLAGLAVAISFILAIAMVVKLSIDIIFPKITNKIKSLPLE